MVFAQMCAEVSKFLWVNKQTKNSFDFYHGRICFEHIFVEETLDKFIGNKTNGFLFIVFPGFLKRQGTNEYFTKWVPIASSVRPPAWQSASQLIVEVLNAASESRFFAMPMCQTIRLWFLSLTQPIYLNKQIA
jgi:hypothetical protein